MLTNYGIVMILLVASNKDIAAMNIAEQLFQIHPFKKTLQVYSGQPVLEASINCRKVTYITLEEESIFAQYLGEDFPKVGLIIFLSRHSSHSGTPTLSGHTPGNFSAAELGGLPRELSVASAKTMQTALQTMDRIVHETQLPYQISYECTHHGPSLKVPTVFMELGSSHLQWRDKKAAAIVAQAAIDAITSFEEKPQNAAVGIGGTHYNQKFTQLAIKNSVTFGHIIPKYVIPYIDKELLFKCVNCTREKVDTAILDWKGIRSEDKSKLLSILQETPLQIRKV
jgi:D-aminoacyl-tRNA deacylase